jgi:hypothetical protein
LTVGCNQPHRSPAEKPKPWIFAIKGRTVVSFAAGDPFRGQRFTTIVWAGESNDCAPWRLFAAPNYVETRDLSFCHAVPDARS